MDLSSFIQPLLGGILIGVSASTLLLLKGRILGVSGIIGGVAIPKTGDTAWRVAALLGMGAAGLTLYVLMPEQVTVVTNGPQWRYVAAGLLVGFGTQFGSGCTSGHGVCGISRLSPRSLVATLTFMIAGMITVACFRYFGGTP